MGSNEIKKLSRRELVDIIYQMKKNEQSMQDEIESLRQKLADKQLRISQAGSIAEVAASIAEVFAAAQKTADLYLQEIARMKEEADETCRQQIEKAKQDAAKILAESKAHYSALHELYKLERKRLQLPEDQL